MLDFSHLISHHLADHPIASLGAFSFTKHMLVMSIAALATAATVLLASRTAGGLRVAIEGFAIFIRNDIARPAMGDDDADAYLPFLLTLFLFIFFMNFLGLFPDSAAATGNISVTATLAATTFFLIHLSGMWRHGAVKHWKNMIPHGVPAAMIPLVFVIELMGYFTKALALCIRLFANMTAGHLVILLFLGLILLFGQSDPRAGLVVAPISVGLALGLYALELLVALIQAYVFTMLTAIFVGGALHPEH
ncbi:MAG: F0F1 ATP synthase subunit A [Elusimicrobia bacterium]|nr:F0F1 ATP synthase subunit A [Elusimicrobiota bacterium]